MEEESNFKLYISEDRIENSSNDNIITKFITMENATSNAISNLDNGFVPIEDYVREADRTKRKTLEEKEQNNIIF